MTRSCLPVAKAVQEAAAGDREQLTEGRKL